MKTLIYTLGLSLLLITSCSKDENDYVQTSDFEMENGHITITLNGKSADGYEFDNEVIKLTKFNSFRDNSVEREYWEDLDYYWLQRYNSVIRYTQRVGLQIRHQKIGNYSDEETFSIEFGYSDTRVLSENTVLNLLIDEYLYEDATIVVNESTNIISGNFEFVHQWYSSENTLTVSVSFSTQIYDRNI